MNPKRLFIAIFPIVLTISCTARIEKSSKPLEVSNKTEHLEDKIITPPVKGTNETNPTKVKFENSTLKGGKKQKLPQTTSKKVSKPISEQVLINIAKLSERKKNPVVRNIKGFLIEAIPKGVENNCNRVIVKVKNSKRNVERNYSILLCKEGIKIIPR